MSRWGEPHESFKVGKYTVNVFHDEHADSPEQWGDEERYIVAWHDQFTVGPGRGKDYVGSYSQFVHPAFREEIRELIDDALLSGPEELPDQPFDGPTDPIWQEDYLEASTDTMEALLVAAGQPIAWRNQDGLNLAHDRFTVRHSLWSAWQEYKKAHSEWAVFELDVRYYGGGCLRISLGYPYNGDPTDGNVRYYEPDGLVVIKREDGVDPKKAAEALVSMWEQYIEGDVWYYEVLNENEEIVENCGGYYGLDDCLAEARSVAEHFVKQDNTNTNTNREAC